MEKWKDLYVFIMIDKDKNQTTLELDISQGIQEKWRKLIYWAILTL